MSLESVATAAAYTAGAVAAYLLLAFPLACIGVIAAAATPRRTLTYADFLVETRAYPAPADVIPTGGTR